MKLRKYFRQLKKFIVLPKHFRFKGVSNKHFYSYHRKIFVKYLFFGLFKDEIKIKFGSDYLKHVPKYLFSLPEYWFELIDYKCAIFYYTKIKKQNVLFIPPCKPLSPSFLAIHLPVYYSIFEYVAEVNGFKIVDQKFTSVKTVFTIELLD